MTDLDSFNSQCLPSSLDVPITPKSPPAPPPQPSRARLAILEHSETPAPDSHLPALKPLNAQLSNLNSFSALLPPPNAKPRNGKIAHLPKAERDMVNRMLANNLPYHKITLALEECGFHVTARNVSNWKTRGGYQEWRREQEHSTPLSTGTYP